MKSLTIACALLLVLPCMAWAVDCPIPDTGQTRCYDNNEQKITCPSPGEDFYGQDAQYPCNPQSYTQLDASGTPMPFSADYSTTPWAMVRDNVTGLMWEVKTDDGSTHDKDNTYTWYDGITGVPGAGTDTQDFIAALNTPPGFGGFTDWRIPTIKELSFIRNIDTYHPAINTVYFPNTAPAYYWSSTSYAYAPTYACGVYFYYGYMGSYKKSFSRYVRAVRGGQCGSFGDFIDNGNGTVTDTSTGLMWQQATVPENYTWEQALSYCETLSLADYDDWRLPDVNELQSIVDYSTYDPSIDQTYFPNTVSSYYWSSTSYAGYPSYAWDVYFDDGYIYGSNKLLSYDVRAVRGGQCGSTTTTTTVIDSDGDGVPNGVDNCPSTPNGTNGGTCSAGKIGDPCMSHGDCGCEGECSMDQEDIDEDGTGDVCDNCSNNCNYDQWDADVDGIGDVCDTTPGCGECTGPQCETECSP